ncbi:MAG: TldD/PmbA family protein [Nitrospiraceae bacterium]|nr:TldD/PmbA family protein [Nitrospiraceae bacterium]
MRTDAGFAAELVAAAIRRGADEAEVFSRSSRGLSIEIKDQSVESLKSSAGFGYALRVIKDGRLGFSYSTDPAAFQTVIGNALDTARSSDPDPYLGLPDAGGAAEVAIYDTAIAELSEDEAIQSVMRLEKAVFEEDRRIARVRKASGSFASSETRIANSKGVDTAYSSTSCGGQVSAVAEDSGESQIGWEYDASCFLKDVSFEAIGRGAAKRAVRLLGSRKIEGCKAEVVLDNSVTVDFLGIFASSLSSEAVQKGKSLLTGKIGRKVISPKITVVDSGLLAGRLGSSPVDDEGVPCREKLLIREGVLFTYVYSTYTARKDNVLSTGNASRAGFASLPGVGVSNLYLEAASHSDVLDADRIIRSIDRGLYVVEAMGVHTANPVSGDFSIGVTGLWIEKGEVKYPVKEAVVSGNILEFFGRIEAIGDDLRFYGSTGAPSLIISGVDISA